MSDLISRKALCEFCINTKDRTVDANDIMRFPSAEPERKNRKTALSVQVKVEFDDMKALLEDIGNLQTYKLFEGDDMVLANIKDIKGILTKHVKAKEVQPERKWIPVSERLPKNYEQTICIDSKGKMMIGMYGEYGWTFPCYMTEPVAWMPLPEPAIIGEVK